MEKATPSMVPTMTPTMAPTMVPDNAHKDIPGRGTNAELIAKLVPRSIHVRLGLLYDSELRLHPLDISGLLPHYHTPVG
jgi:hypothetical protein